MSYEIKRTTQFKRSVKKCKKRGLNMDRLKEAISKLATDGFLPPEYHPHKLSGKFDNQWE